MAIPSYLFFGDSYTCCEKEKHDKNRWPIQFVARSLGLDLERIIIRCDRRENGEGGSESVSDFVLLDEKGDAAQAQIKVIAQTGFRSDQVIASYRAERALLQQRGISFKNCEQAFVMVGVNDQFQKGSDEIEEFLNNLATLIEAARLAVKDEVFERVKVLNIPYWNKTPCGKDKNTHEYRKTTYDLDQSSDDSVQHEISEFNRALSLFMSNLNKSSRYGQIKLVDKIASITLEKGMLPWMTQDDGLHYSARMMTLWVDAIFALEPTLEKKSSAKLADDAQPSVPSCVI